MTNIVRCAAAVMALLAAPAAIAGGDVEQGRLKANTCMGCHGIPSYNNVYPTYRVPMIGGQAPEYIEAALKSYKAGERPHKTMQGQAMSLSDQDIADIAAYLAVAPSYGVPHRTRAAAAPEKAAVCAACHGADGKATQPIYPNLAGQYANYTEHSLKEYRDGARKNAIMAAQVQGLSDADIRQLARYFESQASPLYTPSVHGRQKDQ